MLRGAPYFWGFNRLVRHTTEARIVLFNTNFALLVQVTLRSAPVKVSRILFRKDLSEAKTNKNP